VPKVENDQDSTPSSREPPTPFSREPQASALLAARSFALAKDPECPQQNQDAFQVDAARGIVALADGVSSALFSRQWAAILAAAAAADFPDPGQPDDFARWLAEQRAAWSAQIDTTSLAWFQKAKLPAGAFSTLLWIRVSPSDGDEPGAFGAYHLQGHAVGDTCLFHARHGEILRTFPLQTAAEFEASPAALGSVDLNRDQNVQFHRLDVACYNEDLLVLCTDAIAEWAIRSAESGSPPNWEQYWDMDCSQWQAEIGELRQSRQMRYDDATLLLLRVVEKAAESAPPPLPSVADTDAEEEDWAKTLKEVSGQVSEGIDRLSDRMLHGFQQLKDKAVRKYRDKFKPGKK
jgi:hypothetical protein